VDITAEVERSLRVLDGAVGVFCAVGGVEPQSETVWRQADRYEVPRIAFVNKMDRNGADFFNVLAMLTDRLGSNFVPIQLPIGTGETFTGLIDLVAMKAVTYEETSLGADFFEGEIPEDLMPQALEYREKLLEAVAEFDDHLLENSSKVTTSKRRKSSPLFVRPPSPRRLYRYAVAVLSSTRVSSACSTA